MSVIETLEEHTFPWYVRLFFWNQKRRYGAVLEPARLWGRTPKVFSALALLYGALDRRTSPIDPALRTLVTVRVSQINGCAFCIDINSSTALKRGVDEKKLFTLPDYKSSDLFSEEEKGVLDYVESVTYSDQQPTGQQFEALRHFFNDDAIIELTALVAFQNMSSKFNASLGIEPQGFCSITKQQSSKNKAQKEKYEQ